MGWEPTTFYLYGPSGRLLSSHPEPEWDATEREWFHALKDYRESLLCPLCGMPKTVCRARERDGAVSVESERCHVTAAMARRKRADQQAEMDLPESLAYSASLKSPIETPIELT